MKRALVTAIVLLVLSAGGIAFTQSFSGQLGNSRGPTQPIAFSHEVHAGKLGMDCLYCHYSADKSPIANIPSTATCMGCHRIAMTDRPEIKKLTEFWQKGENPPWVEVYRLPDHVKFNHKRHVKAGVQCAECHGPVAQMPVIYQYSSLKMGWCLSCHRQKMNDPKLAHLDVTMDCVTCHH